MNDIKVKWLQLAIEVSEVVFTRKTITVGVFILATRFSIATAHLLNTPLLSYNVMTVHCSCMLCDHATVCIGYFDSAVLIQCVGLLILKMTYIVEIFHHC